MSSFLFFFVFESDFTITCPQWAICIIAKHHGKSGSTSPASEMAADERAFRMQEKVLIFSTF